MDIITRSARKATRNIAGNHSLAWFKSNAHRAHRSATRRTLADIIREGTCDANGANFAARRAHVVTAYDVS